MSEVEPIKFVDFEFDTELNPEIKYTHDEYQLVHDGPPTLLNVRCYHCAAPAGKRCRTPKGQPFQPMLNGHKMRKQVFKALSATEWMKVELLEDMPDIGRKGDQMVACSNGSNFAVRVMKSDKRDQVGTVLSWRVLKFKGWNNDRIS